MTRPARKPLGASVYLRLGVLAIGPFIAGTNALVIAGLLPDIAESFALSPTTISYSISIYSIVVAVAVPGVALVLPRLASRDLVRGGALLLGIGTAMTAAAPTFSVFIAGRVIAALGAAALLPATSAVGARLVPPERRGLAIAAVAAGFTVAPALGAPLGTLVGSLTSWPVPLWAMAVLGLLVAYAVGIVIPTASPPAPRQRIQGSRRSKSPRPLSSLTNMNVLLMLAATLLLFAGSTSAYILSSIFTDPATGGSGASLAALFLAYGIGSVSGNLVSGPLVDRIGGARVSVGIMLIGFLTLSIITFATGSFAVLLPLFALWGAVAGSLMTPLQHQLISIEPEDTRGLLSWFSTAMYAGLALAPPLGAAAMHLWGTIAVPAVAATALLLGAACLLSWRFRHPRS